MSTGASGASADSGVADVARLEMLPPLQRGMELLSPDKAPVFDVDAFLSSRTRGQDVDTILSELRAYKATLREELIAAVNDEYRDFVSIASAMHRDADQLRALDAGDIQKARADVVQLREQLVAHATELQDVIAAAAEDRKEADMLSTLEEIDDTLTLLAADIGITARQPITALDLSRFVEDDAPAPPARASDISLTRALSRYKWYLELASRVSEEYPQFIAAQSTRLVRIRERMALEALDTLESALDSRDDACLELALSCAVSLGSGCYEQALARIRDRIVQPWLANFMPGGRLEDASAPCDEARISDELYASSDAARDATGLPLEDRPLTPGARGLVRLYNGCLDMICRASHICAAGARAGIDVFGAIWHDVATRLMDAYGAQLFFVGHADAFHQHYTATKMFVDSCAQLAPTDESRSAFLEHSTTRIFERRWQLSAYLHLRMREAVVGLEGALSAPTRPAHGFENGALVHLLGAFVRPWLPSQHVNSLCAREWHFSLQIASRYRKWALDRVEGESDLAALAALPADAGEFEKRLVRTLDNVIMPHLSRGEHQDALRGTLLEALSESFVAEKLDEQVGAHIISALQSACAEPLRHVRAGAAQYRGNRDADGVSASPFVAQLFEPLADLLVKLHGNALAHANTWSETVLRDVFARYAQSLDTISQNLESLRRLKRGTGLDAGALPGAGIYAQMRTDVEAIKQHVTQLESQHKLSLDLAAAIERLEHISNGPV
ncbi:hypothetical protein MCUN1_001491 [Malassezia cuniculi]|uniref:Conserved oligomeric Golgi complex subunit 2 n=1 Tax=Malassezia cuniculi TaxID=948313 RepID=A0AAF0J625_9BASI|nr:hypothetical protein MCUN1_001491 [Malassezia cuniculi]